MSDLLKIQNASVTFGASSSIFSRIFRIRAHQNRAVQDISFSVPAGASIGIVGESGSGKSSLMRAVMGLNKLSAGSITYNGLELKQKRNNKTLRDIQMVFQDPGSTLNPAWEVGAGIVELLVVHKIASKKDAPERAKELFDQVHLSRDFFNSKPHELSGGQKQRVAIARALAVEPRILIADEATSALDVVVQAQILDLFAELLNSTDITLIFITHDLDLVRYLCDTAVVMNSGKLVEFGTVEEVFTHPRDQYTKELLAAAPKLTVSKTSSNSIGGGPGNGN